MTRAGPLILAAMISVGVARAAQAETGTVHGISSDGQACLASMPPIMDAVVHVESSGNPFAIGVVHGRLVRQPRSLEEGMATARYLEMAGRNFSLGLAQINRFNLDRYGLDYRSVFDPCTNLQVGAKILGACYAQAHADMRGALSCYYSGTLERGLDYARHVLGVANAHAPSQRTLSGSVQPTVLVRSQSNTLVTDAAPSVQSTASDGERSVLVF
jgi:type IV secretion system protein VirB1